MLKVLFLRGLPDDNELHAVLHNGVLRHVILGCANVRQALKMPCRSAELLFLGQGPEQRLQYSDLPDVIFNEISDPDSHGLALQRAEQFCAKISAPLINAPAQVRATTRDVVSHRLQHGPGLVVPRTTRRSLANPEQVVESAAEHALPYPVLVRVAGAHGGKSLVKVDSPHDLSPLHALPLDGRDFYISEFVDYRSADGLYRKCRIAVVQGKPFIRHLIVNDGWSIHAVDVGFMSDQAELRQEESRLLESFAEQVAPALQPAIDFIYQALGLDYFGIDGHITAENQLIVFEVNANMNVLINSRPKPNAAEAAIDRIRLAIEALIEETAGTPA